MQDIYAIRIAQQECCNEHMFASVATEIARIRYPLIILAWCINFIRPASPDNLQSYTHSITHL